MDTTTLVSDMTEDGRRIVEHLTQDGFEVTAAFWLKKAEDSQWYFYIASPVAESEHLNEAYSRLFLLIRRMSPPLWIDPLEVRLIGSSNPLARDVLAIHHGAHGPKERPIRWGGTQLGNVRVEEAFLHPLVAAASI